jgi:hypothetical protein
VETVLMLQDVRSIPQADDKRLSVIRYWLMV